MDWKRAQVTERKFDRALRLENHFFIESFARVGREEEMR